MPSPLFKNALKAFQHQALREFRQTDAGKLVKDIERLGKGGKVSKHARDKIARKLKSAKQRELMKSILNETQAGSLISDVQKYARGSEKKELLESLFTALGPVGDLVKGLLRPSGRKLAGIDRELQSAANLLQAFGFKVQPPSRKPAAQRRAEKVDEAKELLESLGFTVEPPKRTRKRPVPEMPPVREDVTEDVRRIGGRERRYKPNDPILTGEMIPVSSSNVHSIGYIWNDDNPMKGTLQVRFLQSRKGGKSKGAGPLYYYYGVHPDVFDAFRRAASKGEFVWDRLRVRGTVSGHRYFYELKGITGGYVPRKATRYGPNEYFIRRRVKGQSRSTGQIREFESELEDQFAGRAQPQRPNFGVPNRGRSTVNRGRPSRGR